MMVGLGAITVSGGRTARAAHCKYLVVGRGYARREMKVTHEKRLSRRPPREN
jgi:hypothetical protein